MKTSRFLLLLSAAATATARAHPGHPGHELDDLGSIGWDFVHLFTGLDPLVAMLAAGLVLLGAQWMRSAR